MQDKILFIDAMNFIHRANLAFSGFNQKSYDDNTNEEFVLIFNFFRNLRPIIEKFSPQKCFFVLEGRPQFRYDLLPTYKANRIVKTASAQESKQDLLEKADKIVELMQYLPVTIAKAVNFECDDVIGTLCKDLSSEDLTIISNDTDYIQLLQRGYGNIKVYSPTKKAFLEAPTVPYIALKSLVGDKSDNIEGFKGIGNVKATKMLSDPDIFEKFMSIEENRALFSINRSLIEFADIPLEEISFIEGNENFDALKEAFIEMEFKSITNDVSWKKYVDTFKCIEF